MGSWTFIRTCPLIKYQRVSRQAQAGILSDAITNKTFRSACGHFGIEEDT